MSNKSQPPQNPGIRKFLESVKDAAEKQKQNQVTIQEPEEFPQAQGQLPLPKSQTVSEHNYQWVWEPILDTVIIKTTYFIDDDKWYVDIVGTDESSWHPEDAKKSR